MSAIKLVYIGQFVLFVRVSVGFLFTFLSILYYSLIDLFHFVSAVTFMPLYILLLQYFSLLLPLLHLFGNVVLSFPIIWSEFKSVFGLNIHINTSFVFDSKAAP